MFYTYSTILLTSGFKSFLTTAPNKYILHLTHMDITYVSVCHSTITMNDIIFHTTEYDICLTLLFYAIELKNTS